jgi:hypothetical protein
VAVVKPLLAELVYRDHNTGGNRIVDVYAAEFMVLM